jgi:quercetin dioxygenase-like cupin family protein
MQLIRSLYLCKVVVFLCLVSVKCGEVDHPETSCESGIQMTHERVYKIMDYMQVSDDSPIRSVITETEHSVIVAWQVQPGQVLAPHIHPHGQDTWTILSGEGQYQVDEHRTKVSVKTGDVVVARSGQVHGVMCTGSEPLRFISVVAPRECGFQPI